MGRGLFKNNLLAPCCRYRRVQQNKTFLKFCKRFPCYKEQLLRSCAQSTSKFKENKVKVYNLTIVQRAKMK